MLASIGLIAPGFLMGVLLAGSIACLLFGYLHAEAVKAVESYSVMHMFTAARPEAVDYKAALR